jgi:hypothetical protein
MMSESTEQSDRIVRGVQRKRAVARARESGTPSTNKERDSFHISSFGSLSLSLSRSLFQSLSRSLCLSLSLSHKLRLQRNMLLGSLCALVAGTEVCPG